MATEGKIPMLGFKAGAIKFLTLFGFSPTGDISATRYYALSASYAPTTTLRGSYDTTYEMIGAFDTTYEDKGSY